MPGVNLLRDRVQAIPLARILNLDSTLGYTWTCWIVTRDRRFSAREMTQGFSLPNYDRSPALL